MPTQTKASAKSLPKGNILENVNRRKEYKRNHQCHADKINDCGNNRHLQSEQTACKYHHNQEDEAERQSRLHQSPGIASKKRLEIGKDDVLQAIGTGIINLE